MSGETVVVTDVQTVRITSLDGSRITLVSNAQGPRGEDGVSSNALPFSLTGDVTGSGVATMVSTIAAHAVTNAKLATVATGTIKGRVTAVTGDVEDLTPAQLKTLLAIAISDISGLGALAALSSVNLSTQASGTLQAAQAAAHSGDVTSTAGSLALTIASGVVSNAKLATAPANTVKGNNTGSIAAPVDMTMSQLKSLMALAATEIANTAAGSIASTTVQAALNELDTEKAPLVSPPLTGTPTAPTAAANTNTTQVSTTAFVTAAIKALDDDVYALRSAFVTAVGGGLVKASGKVTIVEGLAYRWVPGATEIPDLLGLVPAIIRTFRHYGAKGDGTTNDTTAVNLARGKIVDGENLIYGVSGAISLTTLTDWRNGAVKQLSPAASQTVETISATSIDKLRLDNFTIYRNGNGTNSGTNVFPNAALNLASGMHIDGGQYHFFRDVTVTGNDSGTAIKFDNLDKTSKCIRPIVRDIMAVVQVGSGTGVQDDCVQGILMQNCDGFILDNPVVLRLGWRSLIGDATTYVNSRCIVLSGSANIDIIAPRTEDAGQGIDFSGDLGVGNHDCNIFGGRAKNMQFFGLKYANVSYRIRAYGYISELCGYNGFVDSSSFDTMPTPDMVNLWEDCIAINCDAFGVGSKGGFFRLPGSRAYKNNTVMKGCIAVDNRGTRTMGYGFYSEIDPVLYEFKAIDCQSIGHTKSDFGASVVQHYSDERNDIFGREEASLVGASYTVSFETVTPWINNVNPGTATRVIDITSLNSQHITQFSATNATRWEWGDFYPYNPNKLHKITFRIRNNTGTLGSFFLGLVGFKADRTTRVSRIGTNTYATAHYVAVSASPQSGIGAGWTEYVGYFSGSAGTPSSVPGTLIAPATLHTDVRFVRPHLIFNNATGDCQIDMDLIRIETLANAATDISGLGALALLSSVSLTTQATGVLQAAQEPAHTGDVTNTAGSLALTIAAGAVSLVKQASIATGSIMGRVTAATGVQEVLTPTQVKTLLVIAGTEVVNTPAGNIAATTVQAALNELDTEKMALTGGAMTGRLNLLASATGAAGVSIGDGVAPTSPINGDLWITGATFGYRSNGVTRTVMPTSGGTFSGKVTSFASSTANASGNIPAGVAPTSPADGDFWTTTAGLFVRLNGVTASMTGVNSGDQTSLAAITGGNWKVLYTNGSGAFTEVPLGAAGTVLTSNGVALAPTMQAPSGSGDMVLASAQTNSGVKTFLDTSLALRNVANTFSGVFTNTITAARTWTLKDASGTIAFTSDITGTNSGINTGDQTITLTSDVTGTGTGSFAATIAAGAVTLAKQANMATASLVYRKTAAAGPPEIQTLATLKTDLGLTGTNSGDQTSLTGITGGNWKVLYSNGTGVLTEVALGVAGTVLTSNGATLAPTMQTPAGGGGDMVLASAQINSGVKTFLDTTMALRNVANTFSGVFTNTITAARTWTLKDASGTIAFTSDITGTNSGVNTGDQTITLTGDVTGAGTGSFAATIAAGAVSLTKQANIATGSIMGRVTAAAGVQEVLTPAQVKTLLAIANTDVSGLGTLSTQSGTFSGTHSGTSSGANTGDQTITLTSDVTGSGTGSFIATIAAGAVSLAKQANIATGSIMGRVTAATGIQEVLTPAQVKTLLAVSLTTDVAGVLQAAQEPAHTGDVTNTAGSLALTIAAGAVTLAKQANITTGSIMGRVTAATGVQEVLTPAQVKTLLAISLTTDVSGVLQAAQEPAHTGDVTNTAGSLALTIAAGAVTLAKQANLAANSVIGNNTGSAAVPAALALSSLSSTSSVVARDASANTQINNTRQGYSAIATAGGTTVLTVASAYLQFFTGTLAQTITLPDVTTLVLGHQFYIRNNSTLPVTINSSGGNLLRIVGPGTRGMVTCVLTTGTTAASWSAMYIGISIADGKVLTASNNLTLSGTDGNALAINSASAAISNTNTGDQTITLTSDVTGSGTGSFAATIAAGAVTLAKQANITTGSIMGRVTAATGIQEVLTPAQVKTLLAVSLTTDVTGVLQAAQEPAHTGDVTNTAGSLAMTIAANSVTLAKQANIATGSIMGRVTAATGLQEVLTPAQVKTLLAVSLTTDVTGVLQAAQEPAHTGDVTNTAGSLAMTIAAGAVSLAKQANIVTGSIMGRVTAATGLQEVLTPAQVKTLLAIANTDVSGLGTLATQSGTFSGTHSGTSSGTNTGDQTVTLTGDVTGSGTGSFATTIGSATVTLAKMANLAANSIIGNNTGAPGVPIALTTAQVKTLLAIANTDVSGLGTLSTQSGTFSGTHSGSSSGTNTGDQTSLAAITGGNWKVLYTNGSGVFTEVALGVAGTVLTSNGVALAPTMQAPAGSGDMVLATAQTNSGVKTFLDTSLALRNVANTFSGVFTNTITAARVWTLKDASGTIAFTSDITGTNSGTNTGDETAGGLLTKIMTVDGIGSGLDADLLDGLQAASFKAMISMGI